MNKDSKINGILAGALAVLSAVAIALLCNITVMLYRSPIPAQLWELFKAFMTGVFDPR